MPHVNKIILTLLATVSLCFVSASTARADTVVLDAVDSGIWNEDGAHNAAIKGYFVGTSSSGRNRNYFVFDLSGVTGLITDAALQVFNPAGGFAVGSPSASVTYNVYDVTTPIPLLQTTIFGSVLVGEPIFADLGSGVLYGSRAVSVADNNTVINLSLNAAAVTALNNAGGGLFAFGGRLLPDGTAITPFGLFIGTEFNPGSRQLVLTTTAVPEPATMILLGTGLASVGAAVRKRRKARNTEEA